MRTYGRLPRFCMTVLAATLLALSAGCPPANDDTPPPSDDGTPEPALLPILPGASTIVEITATDAVVGGQGQIRVTLGDFVNADTTVTLSSSDPAVITVPEAGTILAGSDQVVVPFTGVAIGQAEITAQLAGESRTTTASVVSAIRLLSIEPPGPLQTGARSSLLVRLNARPPTDVVVNLTSSNPAVIGVPATMTFPSFSQEQNLPVTAGAPGSAVITATLGSSSEAETVRVVDALFVSRIYAIPEQALVGDNFELEVDLNAVPAADTIVALSSSHPDVAGIPGTVTVPAGERYGRGFAAALAVGGATVTAELNSSVATCSLRVTDTLRVRSVRFDESVLERGQSVWIDVNLNARPLVDTVVTLTSSDPAILPVPDSVIVRARESVTSILLNPVGTGRVAVFATLGDSMQSDVILVVEPSTAPPGLSYLTYTGTLKVGDFSTIEVRLSGKAIADTPVTLESSNPTVLSVPSSAIIPLGETSVTVPVAALATGSSRVTASALGQSYTVPILVIPGGEPTLANVAFSNPRVGLSVPLGVTMTDSVLADTTVTLTNSAPEVLFVPASAIIPSGGRSVSIPITGLAASPPAATVTVTVGATSRTVTIEVQP